MTKTLDEVLALDPTTLTDEDKGILKEHEAELTDEQKALFMPVAAETEEAKTAREKGEKEAANVAAGLNADGSAKIEASEKAGMVMIKASTLKILEEKADQGFSAFKELAENKLKAAVDALIFSESNKAGTFLPKSKDNLRAFMQTLNDAQKASFSSILKELANKQSFKEVGENNAAGEGTAKAEVDLKIAAKMKADDKLSYSSALKQVMSENEGLEKRYDQELTPVRGANK